MKRILTLCLSLSLLPLFVCAQISLDGMVKNKQGEPLSVNVTVKTKGSNYISGFVSTDAKGKYNITYNGTADSLTLTVSGVAVGQHRRTVVNRSATVDFEIEEQVIEIKEIVIVPPPINRTGDTLNYVVGAYKSLSDRSIEDVLKRMPGIKVAESGKIQYNGRDINKLYIENSDLLQGRYGIATKNIAAEDVASVQVYENHQPIRALKDKITPDESAINLKLKDSAKGTLAMTTLVGTGYEPKQWAAELAAMYFSAKRQNMTLYKSNNTGNNITSELQSHYDYPLTDLNSSILSISAPNTPAVAERRYFHNRSNTITANQLFKIKDVDLTANISYYNERLIKEGYSFSEQFFPDNSSLKIEEQVKSLSKTNNLDLSLCLNSNTPENYLKNSLNIKGGWNNDRAVGVIRSNVENMDETLTQFLDKTQFSLDNTLNMIKNIGNSNYRVNFSVSYTHKPHSLTVTPVNYFRDDQQISLTQRTVSKDFKSNIKTTYGLALGRFNLDYSSWVSVDIRNLDTQLNGRDILGGFISAADSLKNDLSYNTYKVGVDQSYSYKSKTERFKANLSLPIVNFSLTKSDRIPNHTDHHNKWIINPSLSASYNLTNELTLSTGASLRKSYGNMNDDYTGYIMHSYRTMLCNTIEQLFESSSAGAQASLGYRGALNALFLNLGVNYGNSRQNLLYGYNYQGIMSVKTTIDQPTESESYGLRFSGSKGIKFWQTTLQASSGYSKSRGEQLIQDEILNYYSENFHVDASITTTPASFVNLNYSFSWSQSQSSVRELPRRFPPIRSHTHAIGIWLFPAKEININLKGDYQYNSVLRNRNTAFADTAIRYKHKQTEWELECSNLFNAKRYVSTSYTDIRTYYYGYDLRSRSLLLKVRFKLK